MITKFKTNETTTDLRARYYSWGKSQNPPESTSTTYLTQYGGSSRISYEDGPKYINYRCNWKRCQQDAVNALTGSPATVEGHAMRVDRDGQSPYQIRDVYARSTFGASDQTSYTPIPTDQQDLPEAWEKVWRSIDLNSSEAVLLYSGVIQAVPLVGGALNFVSIMNRAAKKLAKSFKKKPFTTVVKTMISLDFIDRFVVSPTIDDARKFLDAHNYVVRVMNTMYQRNSQPVALDASVTRVMEESKRQLSEGIGFTSGGFSKITFTCDAVRRQSMETKVFLLADMTYNTSSVDPIKLWAARTGITRPLDSVWDLVPFSFVIDYFTRAGDFISGLSDAMSSQDGLVGRVGRIYGAYKTIKSFNGTIYDNIRSTGGIISMSGTSLRPLVYNYTTRTTGRMSRGSYTFRRGCSNPWSYPVQDPSGLLRLDLSRTRLRTLLELLIQAKA